MAHKGKLYPVAFRRDFNLNVQSNNDGWGNRELIHWGQFPTGPAGFWSNSNWDCGQAPQPFATALLWRSEQVRKFGILWWSEFQVTITGNVRLLPQIRLQTVEFGMILEVSYDPQERPVTSAKTGINPVITFWDTGFFDEFPVGAEGSTWRWKFWADGPPH